MKNNVTYVNFKPSVVLVKEDGAQFPLCVCSCGNHNFWITADRGLVVCSACKYECELMKNILDIEK